MCYPRPTSDGTSSSGRGARYDLEAPMRFGTFSYNQARPTVPERQAFDELLEQIELTDQLGFDDAWFAEHHHSDYGLLASPNLIIAALARRTERLRLGNLVNVVPLPR